MNEIAKKRTAEEIIALRDTALAHYRSAMIHLRRAEDLANRAAEYAAPSVEVERWSVRSEKNIGGTMERIRKHMDKRIWVALKRETGLVDLMDAEASGKFDKEVEENAPPISLDVVKATFARLLGEADLIFERGLVNVFRTVCREYKTNDPFRVGKKIIMRGGFWHHMYNAERVADLDRVFHMLDGKSPKPHGENAASVLRAHYGYNSVPRDRVKTDYMAFDGYLNGNIHIHFLRPDLVDKVNLIIARALGGSDKVGHRKAARAKGL